MVSPHTVILGAGLAGLSCARHLGGDYTLYERADAVGGAARTFARGDFLFDVTGHWLHLRDEAITRLVHELLGDELVQVERRASVHSHGVLTPYPYQANTYGLPPAVVADCVLGYFRAREATVRGGLPEPRSFEDYIRRHMGDGIAEHFMIPYNTKLWTVPPSAMAHTWCGRFVPIPTAEEVVRGALQPGGAQGLGYNATFSYPRRGGIGRLAAVLHAALPRPAQLAAEAVAVDWRARRVRFADGASAAYDALVSTLPLDQLVDRLVDPPASVGDARGALRATSVTYWDLALRGGNAAGDRHWIYFPGAEVPFYRAGSASAAMPSLAPPGHRSHYVEVSHPQGTACPVREEELLRALRQVGLLGRDEEPLAMHRSTVACGYVIMDHAYGPARQHLLDWLEAQRILSVGRWGAWTYDSMEGAMVQGRAAAARIRERWHG